MTPEQQRALALARARKRRAEAEGGKSQSQAMTQNMAELSGMTQNPDMGAGNRAEYDALPAWKKPLVALNDMANIAATGLTGGLVNAAAAGVRAPFTDKTYSQELDTINQQVQASRDRAGNAGLAGEIGANVYGVGKVMQAGGTAMRAIPKGWSGSKKMVASMLAGSADGLAINEVMNVGAGNEFGENAGFAAALGGAAPVVGNVISSGASKVAGIFNAKPRVMDANGLKQSAQAAYQKADEAGVIYSPQAMKRVSDRLTSEFADQGFDPLLQPKAGVALSRLQQEAGNNVTLKGLDTVRKVAGNAYEPMNKSNNALTAKVSGAIDDLVQNPQAGDIISGDAQAAAVALKEARDMYGRSAKLEKVEYLLKKAGLQAGSTGSGGNVENATRQQIKSLLTNPKNTRGFSKDEIDQLTKTVLGTPAQNALRLAGKLSPQGNGLMMALGGGAAVANPMVAIPAMVGGTIAKKSAERMTANNVKVLERLIASGGKKSALEAPKNAAQKAIERNKQAVIKILMGSSIPMLANSSPQ